MVCKNDSAFFRFGLLKCGRGWTVRRALCLCGPGELFSRATNPTSRDQAPTMHDRQIIKPSSRAVLSRRPEMLPC
jgi:hypothetical protein